MSKRFLTIIGCGVLAAAVSGCASTTGSGGVTTRAYLEDKERVDQDMLEGENNFGYLFGTPKPEDRSQYKKTRKMYVVEFTKEDQAAEQAEAEVMIPPPLPPRREYEPPPPRRTQPQQDLVLPPIDDLPPVREPARAAAPAPVSAARTGSCTDYTVQSGDTLQKISKRFYDTYKKWKPIYEANMNVIKDPNVLKVGTKLCIPTDGMGENLK